MNPFLNVLVAGNVTAGWDQITENDLELLRRSVASDFPKSGLILWLPFRREGLEPASGVSFSTNRPTSSQTISELTRPDDLRAILTVLRYLESVELREGGRSRWLQDTHRSPRVGAYVEAPQRQRDEHAARSIGRADCLRLFMEISNQYPAGSAAQRRIEALSVSTPIFTHNLMQDCIKLIQRGADTRL